MSSAAILFVGGISLFRLFDRIQPVAKFATEPDRVRSCIRPTFAAFPARVWPGRCRHFAISPQRRGVASIINYGTLLRIFVSVAANPTDLSYQGPDIITQ
jgi:hypothetical protein